MFNSYKTHIYILLNTIKYKCLGIVIIGSFIVELLRGSVSVGQSTLTRFYSLHTFVLPLLTATFMLAHFLMIRKQGISGPL